MRLNAIVFGESSTPQKPHAGIIDLYFLEVARTIIVLGHVSRKIGSNVVGRLDEGHSSKAGWLVDE